MASGVLGRCIVILICIQAAPAGGKPATLVTLLGPSGGAATFWTGSQISELASTT